MSGNNGSFLCFSIDIEKGFGSSTCFGELRDLDTESRREGGRKGKQVSKIKLQEVRGVWGGGGEGRERGIVCVWGGGGGGAMTYAAAFSSNPPLHSPPPTP